MPNHNTLGTGQLHRLYDQTYADTTARDADTTWNGDTSNVGKCVLVGTDEVYMLTAITPTWAQFTVGDDDGSLYTEDGTLAGNRVVTMGSNTLQFLTESANTEWSVFAANGDSSSYSQRSSIQVDHNQIKISDAQASLGVENTEQSIIISPSGMSIQDALNSLGFVYAADYSANATDRWIPDYRAVQDYADSVSLQESNLSWSATQRNIDMFSSGELVIDAYNTASSGTFTRFGRVDITPDLIDIYIREGNGSGATNNTLGLSLSDTGSFFYLGSQDFDWYAEDDTNTPILSMQGGNDGTDLSPYITLHEHMRVGDGKHFNIGKGGFIKWNDGTASTNMFRIIAEVNGSDVFQHMTTDFFGIEHVYQNIDALTWYFDDTGTRQWTVYDDDEGNSPNQLLQLDHSGYLELGISGSPVDIRWKSGVTPDDEWRMRAGASSDRFQFLYYDDSAGTADVVSTFDSVGTWRIAGEIYAEDQTAIPIPPAYPSQIEGAATNYTVTTTYTVITLDSATIDASGSEYTINLANNRVDFGAADGSKVYEVIWHANFLLEGQGTSGATRSSARIKAQLDGVDVTGSEEWCYIREYQGGVNGFADSGTSGSFICQPALDDQLTFLVAGETESGQTLTDFELDSFTVVIKRLT